MRRADKASDGADLAAVRPSTSAGESIQFLLIRDADGVIVLVA